MPTSSWARGVNTTQMSAGDPTSQTKLAATCTNTPPRLPPYCVRVFKDIHSLPWQVRLDCYAREGRINLIQSLAASNRADKKFQLPSASPKYNSNIFACSHKLNKWKINRIKNQVSTCTVDIPIRSIEKESNVHTVYNCFRRAYTQGQYEYRQKDKHEQ